jgi:hypothetical protein
LVIATVWAAPPFVRISMPLASDAPEPLTAAVPIVFPVIVPVALPCPVCIATRIASPRAPVKLLPLIV